MRNLALDTSPYSRLAPPEYEGYCRKLVEMVEELPGLNVLYKVIQISEYLEKFRIITASSIEAYKTDTPRHYIKGFLAAKLREMLKMLDDADLQERVSPKSSFDQLGVAAVKGLIIWPADRTVELVRERTVHEAVMTNHAGVEASQEGILCRLSPGTLLLDESLHF